MFNQGQTGNVRNVDYTDYEEDVYVGYRYFDSFDVPVSYPFGYGLSYTSFEYSDASVKQEGESYRIALTVTNTGKYEGKEVVQLYVSAPDNKEANKPVKELKAYTKTKSLKPGESQVIEMTVKAADLASFDEKESAWVVAKGNYEFLIGASSKDIRLSLQAAAKAQKTKVNNVLAPKTSMNLLHR
jgi:beta-glucosidase